MYLTPGGKPAAVFHPDFTGANDIIGGSSDFYVPELIHFNVNNPLYGWAMSSHGPLMRWSRSTAPRSANSSKPGDLIEESRCQPAQGALRLLSPASVEIEPAQYRPRLVRHLDVKLQHLAVRPDVLAFPYLFRLAMWPPGSNITAA